MTPGPGPSTLFNACDYLLDRHIREGRGDRLAFTGVAGDLSYAELAERVTRAAGGLRSLGLQAFHGECLRTGDTYVVDADGYYACLGRTGDMLKASGIWVAPAEAESRLLAHDDVAQAIVVAAHDTDGLEKPVAFVQLNPGAVTDEETLIEFCRAGLPSFKRPRRIVFVTEYPTTATGKIRRVELRAQAAVIMQGMVV